MTDIVEVTADVDAWGVSGTEASRVEVCERLEGGDGAMVTGREVNETICAIMPSNWVFMSVMVAA